MWLWGSKDKVPAKSSGHGPCPTSVATCTSQVQVITLEDITAPTLEGDDDIDVACDAYDESTSYITASQAYGDFDLTWETNETAGGCVEPVGQFARVYTATDACGNVETFIQFITLVDEVAPEFVGFPADVTVECGEEVFPEPTATDNCSDAADIAIVEDRVEVPGECPGSYIIERTFTATDDCGNAATQSKPSPSWTPRPQAGTSSLKTWSPTAATHVRWTTPQPWTDAAAADITITVDTLAGDCPQSYTLVRTFTATDQCGNATDPRVQTIDVVDNTAPLFVEDVAALAADLTVECDNIPEAEVFTASDECQDIVVQYTETVIQGCATTNTPSAGNGSPRTIAETLPPSNHRRGRQHRPCGGERSQ